ncbi:MAG: response regulator, partial [Candidatus Omnitrophota bacterium]
MNKEDKATKILLVEDNPDDIAITKRALKEANVVNQLWIARDGQEALDFLFRRGQYEDEKNSPRPGLILL